MNISTSEICCIVVYHSAIYCMIMRVIDKMLVAKCVIKHSGDGPIAT
jgi:hypothetical protein